MSAPKRSVRDAEEIGNGFLAARASLALRNAVAHRLSDSDLITLQNAASLLDDIAHGASRTKGVVIAGVKPSRSIAALNVALGPIDTLKRLVRAEQEEISPFFQRLSTAIKAVHDGADPRPHRTAINEAQEFFEELSSWLANELATRKRAGVRSGTRSL